MVKALQSVPSHRAASGKRKNSINVKRKGKRTSTVTAKRITIFWYSRKLHNLFLCDLCIPLLKQRDMRFVMEYCTLSYNQASCHNRLALTQTWNDFKIAPRISSFKRPVPFVCEVKVWRTVQTRQQVLENGEPFYCLKRVAVPMAQYVRSRSDERIRLHTQRHKHTQTYAHPDTQTSKHRHMEMNTHTRMPNSKLTRTCVAHTRRAVRKAAR